MRHTRPTTWLPASLQITPLIGALLLTGPAIAQAAPDHGMTHPASKPSTTLSLTVGSATTAVTPAELSAMPQVSVKVKNAHSQTEETYTGVRVSDVLAKAGARLGKETLRSYMIAAGTDSYWVLYSGEELVGTLHQGEVIVATTLDGKSLTTDGAMKLVSTEDRKPERWVRNLNSLTWKTATQ